MSSNQVAVANGGLLVPVVSANKFYTIKEGVADKTRYQALQQEGISFLNHEATATYIFFDDRLFSYLVFIQDADEAALDLLMKEYLIGQLGIGYSSVNDGSPLRLVWHSPEQIVNYWIFKEELTMLQKFSAGFGVVYRPLEEAIKD